MNGPEHYREAERLLSQADLDVSENWPAQTGEHKADMITAAQVHATLALAAAVAEGYASGLVRKPVTADVFGGPDAGSPWGEALYPLSEAADG